MNRIVIVTLFGIFTSDIEICSARRVCTGFSEEDATSSDDYGGCSITKYWIKDHMKVMSIISGFAKFDNVIILAVSNPSAREELGRRGIIGKRKAILYDKNVVELISVSMETTSGAVEKAVEDFCLNEEELDFTFV